MRRRSRPDVCGRSSLIILITAGAITLSEFVIGCRWPIGIIQRLDDHDSCSPRSWTTDRPEICRSRILLLVHVAGGAQLTGKTPERATRIICAQNYFSETIPSGFRLVHRPQASRETQRKEAADLSFPEKEIRERWRAACARVEPRCVSFLRHHASPGFRHFSTIPSFSNI